VCTAPPSLASHALIQLCNLTEEKDEEEEEEEGVEPPSEARELKAVTMTDRKLGAGGQAAVYVGRWSRTDVAIKKPLPAKESVIVREMDLLWYEPTLRASMIALQSVH
jgi:hypothetical protein